MGGGSKQSSDSSSVPGTLSPVTASLLSLFGGQTGVSQGQFVPTAWNQGGVFGPESFAALPGLLQNQPLTNVEQLILGAQPASAFQLPSGAGSVTGGTTTGVAPMGSATASGATPKGGAAAPAQPAGVVPGQPTGLTSDQLAAAGGSTFGGGLQGLGLQAALQSQGLLQQGAGALAGQLQGPEAAIAQARRSFSQETLPAILERAPGFSSSDLQRELTRGGVDLETNIAALREAGIGNAIQQVPGFAQALGSNLLDQATQVLGFGSLGRELVRDASPSGDAFRVLTALQSLTGPGLTNVQLGSSKGKSTQVL